MNRRAFTLIELLVVIAIIGLLSTIAVTSMNSARSKARDTKRIADIRQIVTAMQLYYQDNGKYPDASGTLGCNCGNWLPAACCLGQNDGATCWAGAGRGCTALTNALAPYMPNIPSDPEHIAGFYGGDGYLYLDTSISSWVTPGPALHWSYDQVSNSNNCLGGAFGQWTAGPPGRSRYWCALTLQP